MKAVILAGGKGLRLREVINDLPKPMAPVAGRPFLEYLVLQLSIRGIRDIILSVGYKGDTIRSHFGSGDRLGVAIRYSEEDEPLGTGGAIKKAARLIDDDLFITMNGDSFLDLDFEGFIGFHKSRKAGASLALAFTEDTERYGRVETDDRGSVLGFSEKGRSGPGLINGGIYIFNRRTVDEIRDGNISVESDVFPRLIDGRLYGMSVNGFFIDMGLPVTYRDLCEHPERLCAGAGLTGPQCKPERCA